MKSPREGMWKEKRRNSRNEPWTSQYFVYDDFLEKFLYLYTVKSMSFAFDTIFKSSFSPKDYITLHLWFFHDLTFYI